MISLAYTFYNLHAFLRNNEPGVSINGGREGGGGHNPISHQKFFQNPSPSWIFIKNPSRSYQNPSE